MAARTKEYEARGALLLGVDAVGFAPGEDLTDAEQVAWIDAFGIEHPEGADLRSDGGRPTGRQRSGAPPADGSFVADLFRKEHRGYIVRIDDMVLVDDSQDPLVEWTGAAELQRLDEWLDGVRN